MLLTNTTKTLLILLFVIFPLGQFTKLASFDQANLYLTDVIMSLMFIIWLLKKKKFYDQLTKSFLIFFLIAFFSLLVNLKGISEEQALISFLYLARLIVYFSLYLVASEINKDLIIKGLIFSGITLAIIGLLQYLLFPDMRAMKYLGWDDHYYRIISTFFDPNFTGIILASTCLLILGKIKSKNLLALCLLPVFLALLLTYSRTSFLAFAVGISTFLFFIRKVLAIPIVLAIFLLVISLLPRTPGGEGVKLERTSSIVGRLESIKEGIQIFKENPILGVGFNTYKFLPGRNSNSHSASGVENSYVLVLATTGIIGFLAFLNILIKFPRKPEIIAVLVSALFINSLFYPWVMIWLFLLLKVS